MPDARNSAQFGATLADAAPALTGSGELALPSLPESTSLSSQELAPALMHSGSMDPTWMPLSQAGGLEPPMVGGAQKLRERTQSYGSASDDGSSVAGATVATRESAGNLAAEFAFLTTPEHQANQMSNLAATHEAAHSSELRRGSSGLQVPPPAAAAPVSAPLPSPTSNPHLQAAPPSPRSAVPPPLTAPLPQVSFSFALGGDGGSGELPPAPQQQPSPQQPSPGGGGGAPLVSGRSMSLPVEGSAGMVATVSGAAPWPSAAPTIVDVSSRDGPSVGGTVVWIHGDNFSSDLVVAFGSIAASDTLVVSPQLIKCTSPPCARRDAQSRHEVPLRLVNAATGAGASLTVPFVYTPEAPPAGLPAELQPELLDRMLKSLVAARAAAGSLGEPALTSLFASADTHGVTLDGYASGLQKMISDVSCRPSARPPPHPSHTPPPSPTLIPLFQVTERRRTDATELQMQHQELAAMMTRERLGSALANRPAPEEVIARNILQAPDAEQEGASKRKRLEGFLKQRPTAEALPQIQPREPMQPRVAQLDEMLGASFRASQGAPDGGSWGADDDSMRGE